MVSAKSAADSAIETTGPGLALILKNFMGGILSRKELKVGADPVGHLQRRLQIRVAHDEIAVGDQRRFQLRRGAPTGSRSTQTTCLAELAQQPLQPLDVADPRPAPGRA